VAAGCVGDPSELADPGVETGPCIDNRCFDGLTCLSNLCVDPDASAGTAGDASDDGSVDPSSDDTTAGGTTTTGADPSSTSGAATTTNPSTSDGGSLDDGLDSGPDDGGNDSAGFIDPTDSGGGDDFECDPWAQDCPVGQKCAPWANDNGNTWNGTHCVDVVPNPGSVGQSCTVFGGAATGEDTCTIGAMCWDVDAETLMGTCIALCSGSPDNASCPGTTICVIVNSGALPLCLPDCDPIAQDCPGGHGCYPVNEGFVCAPDASGNSGSYGDSCANVNACDPSLGCIDGQLVPGCISAGCCSPFCDLNGATCPAGTDCLAWFEEGQAPPGFSHVGVCASP
jgi:hypothetical protein